MLVYHRVCCHSDLLNGISLNHGTPIWDDHTQNSDQLASKVYCHGMHIMYSIQLYIVYQLMMLLMNTAYNWQTWRFHMARFQRSLDNTSMHRRKDWYSGRLRWNMLEHIWRTVGYPLVNYHNYGKSTCLLGKLSISTFPIAIFGYFWPFHALSSPLSSAISSWSLSCCLTDLGENHSSWKYVSLENVK